MHAQPRLRRRPLHRPGPPVRDLYLGPDSTLAPAPPRVAAPGVGAGAVVIGLGLTLASGVAAFSFVVAAAAVVFAALAGEARAPEPSLGDVLTRRAPLVRPVAPVAPAPVKAAEPIAEAPARARVVAPPEPEPAPPPAPDDDAVEMSLAELRSYLGERARASAAPVGPSRPASPASIQPPPRPIAAPALAQVVAPPVAPAPAVRRAASGRQVVMTDGYPPLDPVAVELSVDADAKVWIDGQQVVPGALVLEAGTHEVRVQGARGDGLFELAAGDGDAWCFSARSRVRRVPCRGR